MRDRSLPTSESTFYQRLRDDTLSSIYWERLELKSDTGYPDSSFVLRNGSGEGTCEFKFQKTAPGSLPNLGVLMESTQQPNFLDYFAAGGRRRFLLCCNKLGAVHFYDTQRVCDVLRGKGDTPMSTAYFEPALGQFIVHKWLPLMLRNQ